MDKKNSLSVKFPELLTEWDYDNNVLTPDQVSYSSAKKIHWVCSNKHQWVASPNSRTGRGNSCPVCSNRLIIEGVNDVGTTNPEIANWWNSSIPYSTLSKGSRRVIDFKCPTSGHLFSKPLKRFNFTCNQCNIESRSLSVLYPDLASEYNSDNIIPVGSITYNSASVVKWDCETCGNQWETALYQRVNSNTGCPACEKCKTFSEAEKEIVEHLNNTGFKQGVDFIENDRSILGGQELDIYFPDLKVAIEYNGLYWHSMKPADYHFNKWKSCKEKNVQLITVWEDDWVNSKNVVKNMLSHKLHRSSQPTIFGRNTLVQEISFQDTVSFLKDNHIQGPVPGTLYLGLFNKEELVAVSVWRKTKHTVYLDRYASSCIVVGGLGKMLKHFLKTYQWDITEIVTFADCTVSNGSLYEKIGFTVDKHIKPDYSYVVNKVRVHKFNYRKERFKNDPKLLYVDGLSESELARLNKIPRIWDAGKIRYVYHVERS